MTAPEWRDCADPDELAAAVAAGVEVLRMRGGGWVPSALTHRDDFAWFLTHGTRYQLPASWTWRPEPTALAVLPTPLPVPPWPGAVLSGLVDEDGEPTWLALAPNVLGEAVRTCIDFPWFICGSDNAVTPYWVEVRAPRAVPEPETERVPWYRAPGRRQPGGDLLGPIVQAYPNPNLPGGMYVEYELPEHGTTTGNPNRHPDGMVEVLKDGAR